MQPAPARDFRPLESCHRHFPNPNPNLQNTLQKKLLKSKKNNHSMGVEPTGDSQLVTRSTRHTVNSSQRGGQLVTSKQTSKHQSRTAAAV